MARLLGPLVVETERGAVPLGGARQRAVLAQLLLQPGRVVTVDRLIDTVWGDDAAEGVRHTLQVHVSSLRRCLRDAGPDGTTVIERAGDGYRMAIREDQVDVGLAAALAESGRRSLAAGQADIARHAFDACLALWRGPALADFPHERWARAEARRLEEMRLGVIEDRVDADMSLGRHAALVAELEALVQEHPLRERLRGRLMLALYRSERQTDALAAYRAARAALVEEIGAEPGHELRRLHQRILAQDPGLHAATVTAADAARIAPRLTWEDPERGPCALDLLPDRDRYTLGRVAGSDVCLEWDELVSRAHAEVLAFGGAWTVVDEGLSRNGTLVNGDLVTRRLLVDGDVITVGSTRIGFHHPEAADLPLTRTPVA